MENYDCSGILFIGENLLEALVLELAESGDALGHLFVQFELFPLKVFLLTLGDALILFNLNRDLFRGAVFFKDVVGDVRLLFYFLCVCWLHE